MIAERALRLGPLGRRLLAAFLVVALVSVALVTAAALIGTTHGITANRAELRAAAAQGAADAAAEAYVAADGWEDADLRRAGAIATAAGARLVVRDAQGEVVSNSGPGEAGDAAAGPPDDAGAGGAAAAAGPNALVRPVVADGVEVGSVRVGFGPTQPGPGQQIAWTWTLAAAIVAMLIATIAAWFVARRITGPLNTLMGAVRGFAAGDRTQRAESSATDAPGELGELARSFNSTADSVALSEATRRRMAADVAHELRTPLAALQAGLEELTDGYLDPEPEVLRGLHAQSVRLGRIVADLSELTNAESASLSMARVAVDVGEIAADAVDAATPVLAAGGGSRPYRVGAGLLHCWRCGSAASSTDQHVEQRGAVLPLRRRGQGGGFGCGFGGGVDGGGHRSRDPLGRPGPGFRAFVARHRRLRQPRFGNRLGGGEIYRCCPRGHSCGGLGGWRWHPVSTAVPAAEFMIRLGEVQIPQTRPGRQ